MNIIIAKRHLKSIMAIIGLMALIGCSSKQIEPISIAPSDLLTSGTWNLKTTTVDKDDTRATVMTLTFFSDGIYNTTNHSSPDWPTNGKWKYNDGDKVTIIRDDKLNVSIDRLTQNELVLSYIWPTNFGDQRYVYTFSK